MSSIKGDFFTSQGPPDHDQIVEIAGFRRARQRVDIDLTRRRGTVRLVVGQRGVGKSTCLEFLNRHVTRELGAGNSLMFDAGLHIPQILAEDSYEIRVAHLFTQLAKAMSAGKADSLADVATIIKAKGQGIYFLFVDNLDRLYHRIDDLEFIRYFFQTADPTLKALAGKMVIFFSCAPEWEDFLRGEDLSYLNYPNRITLRPLDKKEIEQLVRKRLGPGGSSFEKLFESDLVPALATASRGNPRRAFQYLEQAMLPLGEGEKLSAAGFQEAVQSELFEGAREDLSRIASDSKQVSWGVNQLWRFFDRLQKAGVDDPTGIATLISAYDTGSIRYSQLSRGLRPAVARIAHPVTHPVHGQSWTLNDQVRTALTKWRRATRIDLEVLLAAYAERPPTASVTDVEEYVEEFLVALDDIPKAAEDFNESVTLYISLSSVTEAERNREKLVLDAWRCVERLMLSITAIRIGEEPIRLRSQLDEGGSPREAADDLIRRVDELYISQNKSNPYKSELQAIKERMLDVRANPEVVAHWESRQIRNALDQVTNSFEGLMRSLRPRKLGFMRDSGATSRISKLLAKGESQTVEFKSSLRWNYEATMRDKALEQAVVKTIAAFMNADGGKLLLGVSDEGEILGLNPDYRTLKRSNPDGFGQKITTLVAENMGADKCAMISIEFHKRDGRELALMSVARATQPVFVKKDSKKTLYVRTQNSTREFDIEEAHNYIERHWPGSDDEAAS